MYVKMTCLTIACAAILSLSAVTPANAQTAAVGLSNGGGGFDSTGTFIAPNRTSGTEFSGGTFGNGFKYFGDGFRYADPNPSAFHFFSKGVRTLKNGELEKSATAFEIALKNTRSKEMNKLTLHYLAYINHQLGHESRARDYADAYLALDNT